nr:hypothetical protein [Tanacetum cinerariifolium]
MLGIVGGGIGASPDVVIVAIVEGVIMGVGGVLGIGSTLTSSSSLVSFSSSLSPPLSLTSSPPVP